MDNNFNNQGEYHNYSQQPPQGGYPQPQDYPTPPYYDPNSQGDPNQPNSGLAIASMVLGICGVVFGCCTYYIGFLLGIIGIALGAVAPFQKDTGQRNGYRRSCFKHYYHSSQRSEHYYSRSSALGTWCRFA